VVQLKPHDPESKGVVERANRYLVTSFLPGRQFTSPEDFNAQLDTAPYFSLTRVGQMVHTGAVDLGQRVAEVVG
jgi:hypothetical protein